MWKSKFGEDLVREKRENSVNKFYKEYLDRVFNEPSSVKDFLLSLDRQKHLLIQRELTKKAHFFDQALLDFKIRMSELEPLDRIGDSPDGH